MNSVLQPYLRKFAVVFLDDILIYSKTWQEHLNHIKAVLDALRKNVLFCNSSKCEFGLKSVLFLGHHIDGHHLPPDSEKIKAAKNWPAPSSVTQVKQFIGFAKIFRRLLFKITTIGRNNGNFRRHTRFEWNNARQQAFESLKSALLNAPVLRLANVDHDFRVVTDASDFAIAGVLLQQGHGEDWHAVAYTSRKLTSAEHNYTVAERETLAVIYALNM